MTLFSAGAHPLAKVRSQVASADQRYRRLEKELGVIAMRAMICATHIHVEAPEPENRIALMNRLIPFLPLFYALSISSPFWQGRDFGPEGHPPVGLRGMAPHGAAGAVRERGRLQALCRPAGRSRRRRRRKLHLVVPPPLGAFPHHRAPRLRRLHAAEDAVAIAALYQALCRCLARRPEINEGVGAVERGVCASNIWLVQQHGAEAWLIDTRRERLTPLDEHLEEAIALAADDAEALGSTGWVLRTREIVRRGTGADMQLAAFRDATAHGSGVEDAMRAVINLLGRETVAG